MHRITKDRFFTGWHGLLLVLTLVLSNGLAFAATKSFVFNMAFPLESTQAKFQTGVAQAVFDRLGVPVQFVRAPAERALQLVNDGVDDGNLIRIAGLSRVYPNLIMVDEPLIDYDFIAITLREDFAIAHWQDLIDREVALISGWKIFESNVPAEAKLSKVANGEQLMRLLKSARVEVALYERLQAIAAMRQAGVTGAVIHEPPLAKRAMHMYVNRQHADLSKRISQELLAMKRDGTYAAIYQSVYGILLRQ